MDYMGLVLFLWIVGGSCIGLFIADRMAPSRLSRASVEGPHHLPRETV